MKTANTNSDYRSSITRRDFFRLSGRAGCAAMTSIPLVSTLLNLSLTRAAVAAEGDLGGYKALVCVFLFGGNDSYNMLVPDENTEFSDYASVRGNLALGRNTLHPITDINGRRFGIHPGMPEVRDLYASGNLAFVANVGSLVAPTDRMAYQNKINLPLGLFSHNDQQQHWQTSVPQSRSQINGWAGRMADAITDTVNSNPAIAMNISLNRANKFQTGSTVIPYIVSNSGATTLSGYGKSGAQNRILTQITDGLLAQTYADLQEKTYANIRRSSIDAAQVFNSTTGGVNLQTVFPETSLGGQLSIVSKIIAARAALGQTRQIFFVSLGGFDHHDDVLNRQATLLPQVSSALRAFYDATVELGVENDVATFTASDFGRTLSSNGNGSDHAWGGNHIVMGKGVIGGHVYGDYPTSLALGNNLDIGRGRLIPTTAVDEYNAELALWFGLTNNAGLETVLPNIRNFYATGAGGFPVGFMRNT